MNKLVHWLTISGKNKPKIPPLSLTFPPPKQNDNKEFFLKK
jgi:hypothetical protein